MMFHLVIFRDLLNQSTDYITHFNDIKHYIIKIYRSCFSLRTMNLHAECYQKTVVLPYLLLIVSIILSPSW